EQAEQEALIKMQKDIAQGVWGELATRGEYTLSPENMRSFGLIGDAWYGLVRSSPAMAAQMLGGAVGVSAVYQQIYGAKYDQLISSGIDAVDAAKGAQATALYSAPLEFLGNTLQLRALAKGLTGKKMGDFVVGLAESMLGEGVEEYTQQFAEEWGSLVAANPEAAGDVLFNEFLSRVPGVAVSPESLRAAATGAIGGAMLPIGGKALRTPFDIADYAIKRVETDTFNAQQVELNELVQATVTAEQNPAMMEKFLNDQMGLKDQDAFVDGDVLMELEQANPVLLDEIVQEMGARKDKIMEAAAQGRPVRLNLGAYHSRLSSEAKLALFNGLKATPGSYSSAQIEAGLAQTTENFEEQYQGFLESNEALNTEIQRIEQESLAAGADARVAAQTAQIAARMSMSVAENSTDGDAIALMQKIQFGPLDQQGGEL
ncbi:MAG: hypothetical protein GY809_12565, partial [Planctomycetes bacterium]|nr:hypothetical protein [Planctomycetota bacterium]